MHPHLPAVANPSDVDPAEGTSSYWIDNAQKTVQEKATRPLNQSKSVASTFTSSNLF